MIEISLLLAFGFLLGMKHALDADHVVAVSTIVSKSKSIRKSSLIGAFWGLGHTTTLLIVGIAILALKLVIPQAMALSFEFLVGIMLVALGLVIVRKFILEKYHFHFHEHESSSHIHFHSHRRENNHSHMHRPFLIGLIHGLAGTAALSLLVLASVQTIYQGILYILIFGLGSITGMLIMSSAISLPIIFSSKFINLRKIELTAGLLSVLLGLVIISETYSWIYSVIY